MRNNKYFTLNDMIFRKGAEAPERRVGCFKPLAEANGKANAGARLSFL